MALYRIDGPGGWMTVVESPNASAALREAKVLARSASLLSTDIVGPARPATQEDIDGYRSMGGLL